MNLHKHHNNTEHTTLKKLNLLQKIKGLFSRKKILLNPADKYRIPNTKKQKLLKALLALVSTTLFLSYLYYYNAPSTFSLDNTLPIAIFVGLFALTIFSISINLVSWKKSLLLTLIFTTTLFLKRFRIIPIITYAICIPLLFANEKKQPESLELNANNS